MKYLIILVFIIAVLAYILNRRGSTGMSKNGSTDTVEGSLGQGAHRQGPGGGGIGGVGGA